MPKKREGKRHPLNVRTTFEIRQRLERAASASGRSMVQEVEYRLERSFNEGDLLERVFGPPEVQRVTRRAVIAFTNEGQTQALLSGVSNWLTDEQSYVRGMIAACVALMVAAPKIDPPRINLWCEAIKSSALTYLANFGKDDRS